MGEEQLPLFDSIMSEFKKGWDSKNVEDMIDSAPNKYKWDHVLIQSFFYNLGKKLGFKVACEKFEDWDVAWVKDNVRVRVEVEHGARSKIAEAFSRICRTSDEFCQKSQEAKLPLDFFGILVINHNLVGQTSSYKDYFFDYVLSEEMGVYYPQMKELNLLIIDIAPELEVYRWAKVGLGRKYDILYTRSFKLTH